MRKKITLVHVGVGLLLWLSLGSFSMADAVRCKDKSGNVIFTDNVRLCYGSDKKVISVTSFNTEVPNKRVKANFRVPHRAYQKSNSTWNIYTEKSLVDGDPELTRRSLKKLEKSLEEIFSVLPENPVSRLRGINFYLMWGKQSPHGGRKSGMSYIREGEPLNYAYLDPRWNHAIVIYSAKNLIYLTELWAKKSLMHELAHAWHITNWPEKHPPIVNAYQNAKQQGLYLNVENVKGKLIPKAYAMKNQLEYFAELSVIYFVGGNYFPFRGPVLANYDENGYNLLKRLWN